MRLLVAGVLSVLLAFAGCLTPPQKRDDVSASNGEVPATSDESGTMTADESTDESSGLNVGFPPGFYAQRVTTISGDLSLATLPVALSVGNGPIVVGTGPEGAYALVVTTTAYGLTEAEAKSRLDRAKLVWTHERDGRHVLEASVETEERPQSMPLELFGGVLTDLVLQVPSSLVVNLVASTTNGDVRVEGIHATAMALATTNGAVSFDAITADVLSVDSTNGAISGSVAGLGDATIGTTNGDIVLVAESGRSGAIVAGSTNGDVDVLVPEAPEFGYSALLETTNGKAEVRLSDGDAGAEDETNAWFVSRDFDGRPIRVQVMIGSTNGGVAIGPADR